MSRRGWTIFAVVSGCGEVCSWTWPHVLSFVGPWLWVASLVLLLPGNLTSTWLIHRLLWTGPLSLLQLRWIQALMEVSLNAVLWVIACQTWKALTQSRLPHGGAGPVR
jgi:hypothetical protein